jgi:hypothetical protein
MFYLVSCHWPWSKEAMIAFPTSFIFCPLYFTLLYFYDFKHFLALRKRVNFEAKSKWCWYTHLVQWRQFFNQKNLVSDEVDVSQNFMKNFGLNFTGQDYFVKGLLTLIQVPFLCCSKSDLSASSQVKICRVSIT